MIVVINPSEQYGRSFKGLHLYASQDERGKPATERVAWMETRNLATNDPAQAWKIMAATAHAQQELKRAAGERPGRRTKSGPVLHAVLSFDVGEPQDRESMAAAADEFLTKLGHTTPLKSGKRRQFADEHQVVMYAHTDGMFDEDGKQIRGKHLHLMINRVHPEHGLNLPDKYINRRSQAWALDYSERKETAHKTPARGENAEARANGQYVKGPKRLSRKGYEVEKRLKEQAANDNDPLQQLRKAQKRADHVLFEAGRTQNQDEQREWQRLYDWNADKTRAIGDHAKRQLFKVEQRIFEAFRPKKRAHEDWKRKERATFEAMERNWFGRLFNTITNVSFSDIPDGQKAPSVIKRTYQVTTNASIRKEQFERRLRRADKALEREQAKARQQAATDLKTAQRASMDEQAAKFEQRRALLNERIEAQRVALKRRWATRNADRAKETAEIERLLDLREKAAREAEREAALRPRFERAAKHLPRIHSGSDDGRPARPMPKLDAKVMLAKPSKEEAKQRSDAFNRRLRRAKEQDNERDRDQ